MYKLAYMGSGHAKTVQMLCSASPLTKITFTAEYTTYILEVKNECDMS